MYHLKKGVEKIYETSGITNRMSNGPRVIFGLQIVVNIAVFIDLIEGDITLNKTVIFNVQYN
jgi:hypothetical protein